MATRPIQPSGAMPAPAVEQALAAIAHDARQRQYETGADGCRDPLLSWERVVEFDAFRITVRCDYNLGQDSALQARHGSAAG